MKLIDVIEWVTQQFEASDIAFGHGTQEAYSEAVWLVLWCAHLPLDSDLSTCNNTLDDACMNRIKTITEQRIKTRKPLAYLTQEAWLQGIPFYVDERSIIPRSFIAELLFDRILDAWLDTSAMLRVLDVCTGNGSLAILSAMAYPQATIVASDISPKALEVAAINVARHQLQDRITLLQSDGLVSPTLRAMKLFDLIVCNPPYVPDASMKALPKEYQAEPALSLAGGLDGMDFIRRFLPDALSFLSPQGILVLEVGHEFAHFEQAFPMLEPIIISLDDTNRQEVLILQAAHPTI